MYHIYVFSMYICVYTHASTCMWCIYVYTYMYAYILCAYIYTHKHQRVPLTARRNLTHLDKPLLRLLVENGDPSHLCTWSPAQALPSAAVVAMWTWAEVSLRPRSSPSEVGASGGAAAWHACTHGFLPQEEAARPPISLLSPILPRNFLLKIKNVDGCGSKGTHTLPSPEMPFRITAEDLYLYQGLAVSQTSLEGSLEGFVFPMPAASRC